MQNEVYINISLSKDHIYRHKVVATELIVKARLCSYRKFYPSENSKIKLNICEFLSIWQFLLAKGSKHLCTALPNILKYDN